jgi:replicative DNA helicase
MNDFETTQDETIVRVEQSLLGCVLLDSEAIYRACSEIEIGSFLRQEHQVVFAAMTKLAASGKPIDVLTVYSSIEANGQTDLVSLDYLGQLSQCVPSAINLKRYADIVIEANQARNLAKVGQAIFVEANLKDGRSVTQKVDSAQMLLAKLSLAKKKGEPRHIKDSASDYMTSLQEMSQGKSPAIPTGFLGLDKILSGGIRRGEMMVIGARPKHGKTAVSLAMARNMAREYNVLFLSQEMPVNQLMHRHTAAVGGIELGRLLDANVDDIGMWDLAVQASTALAKLNLMHDDQAALSLMDVRRKSMKVKRERGLDVLFVDFLQLMQGGGDENRNRELDVISNSLKALALDLEISVILLSQMNRKADESYSKPTMTHLRDSGAIEAAADQIALLFTDHAHPLSKKESQFYGYSSLEIVAHRNGPCGMVPLHFEGRYQKVVDWSGPIPQPLCKTAGSRGFE